MAEIKEDCVLSIEDILAKEADAIVGPDSKIADQLSALLQGKDAQKKRFDLNADDRATTNIDEATIQARKELYRRLNGLNRAALCFSGGGIRSATFCLGILQALASCKSIQPEPEKKSADGNASADKKTADESRAAIALENSLLGCFHYLSTVSGGGYVGSWLSAWRTRASFSDILNKLTKRPNGPDFEPPEISWLRAYSNYLTPRIGLGSADTWAAIAIVVRNMILNWLVIIPVVCFGLLVLKLIAAVSTWVAHDNSMFFAEHIGAKANDLLVISALLGAVVCLIIAQAFTTSHRPARRPEDSLVQIGTVAEKCRLCRRSKRDKKCLLCRSINVDDTCFIRGDLLWAVISAAGVTIFFSSRLFAALFDTHCQIPASTSVKFGLPLSMGVAGVLIYWAGWRPGNSKIPSDRSLWAASGAVYGALVGLGAYLYSHLHPYTQSCIPSPELAHLLLPIILGVPWVLTSQLIAETVFVGLVSYEPGSDSDREWLGRAAGWLAAVAIAWAVVAFLVFAGGYAVEEANPYIKHYIVTSGGIVGVISGIVTALLGSSSRTPAKSSSAKPNDYMALAYNIGLVVAGPIFAAILIVVLSISLDKVLFGDSLINFLQGNPAVQQTGGPSQQEAALSLKDAALSLQGGTLSLRGNSLTLQDGTFSLQGSAPAMQNAAIPPQRQILSRPWIALRFAIGLITIWAVACIASRCVNINRFSLHALYRNRLVRAFLGATRDARHPDRFTGFDPADNIRMHELWSPDASPRKLFHVVNIALNVVSTKRLAWQERKAESFTATPCHCGSAYVGFRPSNVYGDGPMDEKAANDPNREFGIALGTAMAISGAAVSPNMGYNSSPSIELLLTLFNVRLGWWFGNPGPMGNQDNAYKLEGPKRAARPLFDEALGRTTDENPYVYLSDGGHFENLGLYEMVRRRCRFIVVVDAGCDPDFTFEDLGNAVRKIYIDLGVRITFDGLQTLVNRPGKKDLERTALTADHARQEIPYHAIGTIEYAAADGNGCKNGTVIYIKPAYHGTEGAAIRSYATANKAFPHETTTDQWFTESQFESYRALGLDIGNAVLEAILHDQNSRSTLRECI